MSLTQPMPVPPLPAMSATLVPRRSHRDSDASGAGAADGDAVVQLTVDAKRA